MGSSEDEEDCGVYGTPLEPIEEDDIPSKRPITIEDQYAKDEHGRRRFHGAFTGGFSAGFCNTVGSLEGWLPSNFKSSRSSRAERSNQSVFDFMDDEDKGQHGICPMSIKVKPSFDDKTSESSVRKRAREVAAKGPIPGIPVAHQIFTPARDTIGVKLLVKMGWRPGQGVGPRITKREKKATRKQENIKKIYSCSLPPGFSKQDDESEESDYDIDFELLTFAPDDYKHYIMEPKQNVFGLGYRGMDRKPILSSGKSSLSKLTVNGKTIRGQAFGVSVFEDEDDDIYTTDDITNYDFTMDPEEDSGKKRTTSYGCIEGFHIAKEPLQMKVKFPLPTIPIDFIPLKSRKSRWGDEIQSVTKSRFKTIEERMQIMSDDIPTISKVVETNVKTVINENHEVSDTSDYSFKPFATDENKQNRYEKFLKFRKIGLSDCLSSIQPPTMTEWEKEREKSEFEQVARLYRPMSNDMADRFTSGGFQDNVHNILEPVAKTCDPKEQSLKDAVAKKLYGSLTRKKYSWVPDRILCKRFNVPEPVLNSLEKCIETTKSQKPKSSSIFEFLKSEIKSDDLRFDAEEKEDSVTNTLSETQSFDTVHVRSELKADTTSQKTITSEEVENRIDSRLDNNRQVEEEIKDSDFVDDTNAVTNKTDLFKAIFLSSSESEGEDDIALQSNVEKYQQQFTLAEHEHVERKLQYSPPRGIFANLDLDSLQTAPFIAETSANDLKNTSEMSSTKKHDSDIFEPQITVSKDTDNEMYGPVLPSSTFFPKITQSSKKDEELDHWVEKSHKYKKKKKKSKKHKHKKK